MRSRRALAALAAALFLGACGGSGSDGGSSGRPNPDDFNAEVASFDLATGNPGRILVGGISNDQRFLVFGTVKLRFAYLGTKQDNEAGEFGQSVTARFLPVHGTPPPNPLPADPIYATGDLRGVYAAVAGFAKAGFYRVEMTVKVEGKERKATAALAVNERHSIPGVGDPALPTENLTVTSTDAPKAAVDSRATGSAEVPDAHLHQTTIAAALAAKRPAVVVFATPTYCQSKFCGPVTDLVGELARTYADRASFIHVEIWRDFQNQTINRAAADWLLRDGNLSEPWVFVIGADGRITARFDNVATQEELDPILRQLPVIGPAT